MVPGVDRRGMKRKREDDLEGRLKGKLHHSLHEVRKAAKKAKTFETQKLVKKLKGASKVASNEGGSKAELEEQLEALKSLDYDLIGTIALINKLKKDKMLHRYPAFQLAMSQELPSALVKPSGLAPQLEARLLSSKALSSGVQAVILSLRSIVQPDTWDNEDDGLDLPAKLRKLERSTASAAPADADGNDDDDEEKEEDMGLEVGGGDVVHSHHRKPDDEWESGTIDQENDSASDLSTNGNGSDEFDDDQDCDGPKVSVAPPSRSTKTVPKVPTFEPEVKNSESTFLPSLSVGFTRGDSESEWSDSEARLADSIRKNRRGQRARRAIWEKKYGKNAKHLKKGSAATPPGISKAGRRGANEQISHVRNDAWNTKGKSRTSRDAIRPPSRRGMDGNDLQPHHGARAADPQNERPIHPSWEAKKRLKEKEGAAIVPSQGIRIKFDS